MPRAMTHRKSVAGLKRPSITISLAPELDRQLRAEADELGLATSWIIEDLLKAHFARLDAEKIPAVA
jgi:hypothetical protein